MSIEITYDRAAKEYQWVSPDGEIVTAPSKSKAELFRAAVAVLDPELDTAVRTFLAADPQLERVMWRGVEIVVNGGVEVLAGAPSGIVAMVDGSDEYGRYALEATEYGIICQCVHFADGYAPLTQSGNRICKHIAAYTLHIITREDRF